MKSYLAGTRSHPLKTSLSRWLLTSVTALTLTSAATRTVVAGETGKATRQSAKAIPEGKVARGSSRSGSPVPPSSPSSPSVAKDPRKPAEAISAGLDYLLKQQQPGGGWGQGGGWRQAQNGQSGRKEGAEVEDPADLGNTCVSLMALLRAGQTPAQGTHREEAQKAFEFICRHIEQADLDSLYVTPVRDTQLQVKIGTYVDTFLAGWVLSELKGHLAGEEPEKRRAAALEKVVSKIERHQKEDGSFGGNAGWAAVLSQGLCSRALNSASRSGTKVNRGALDRDQKQNMAGLDVAKGTFSAPASGAAEPSSAGVSLYRETAKLGGLWETKRSNVERRKKAEATLADAAAPAPQKDAARAEIEQVQRDDQAAQVATTAVASKLANQSYVAGFGNNGGEEFLSYMNLTESVREAGGKEWESWKPKMQSTIAGAQNADGSWSGNHCITGRTFCTSTALLTLLAGQTGEAVLGQTATPEPVVPVVAESVKP